MSKARVFAGVGAALVVAGAVAAFAIAWRPAMPATDPSSPQAFDPALVKRGRELAALGNCNTCHTTRGGRDFAGGLPVPTPFGNIATSSTHSDYREVDGFKMPFKTTELIAGQTEVIVTVEKVQHNTDIPDEKFALPEPIKKLAERQGTTPPTTAPAPR